MNTGCFNGEVEFVKSNQQRLGGSLNLWKL